MTMKTKHTILGVHLTDRLQEAGEVQRLLTASGGYIKTRLGLHDVAAEGGPIGSKNGLLLLEMVGPDDKIVALMSALNRIDGVEVKSMVFDHPVG